MKESDLQTAISDCMFADQARLFEWLAQLRARSRSRNGKRRARAKLVAAIKKSARQRQQRFASLPRANFPDELPITSWRQRIAETIAANPVTIVCGETGSGKTTQLPKICLSMGRGVSGYIGHTQPRRLAARGVAARIAWELDSKPGRLIGHKIRFDQDIRKGCYVKVMTDGILLAEIQTDPSLPAYDTLIIDEAHERSLNVDFLLGYLKVLLPSRADLKLIVSSATIDTQRFSDFFDGAPIVEVEGRVYPVEVRYRPPEEDSDRVASAVEAITELWRSETGDILAFFPGERDILDAARILRGKQLGKAEILPLYARLPLTRQRRAIEPGGSRRVVLATNVAETSLTVPNVRCVVDTGVARISRYNRHAGVQRLPIEPIPRASAAQRMGRCGRIAPGVCVRLYSEADYEDRPEFGEPEILRTNLGSVLLRMRALGMRDLQAFPFIDPPRRRHVNDGLRLLRELGALDGDDELTDVGRRLARLPLDPRLGRMLLAAESQDCVADILVIAAALSVADPRDRPPGRESAAAAAHKRYRDERSDFLTLLNLWELYRDKTGSLPEGALYAFCRKRFLSVTRMREWQDVHDQLRQLVSELGIRRGGSGSGYARLHRALLAGLLRNVGFLGVDGEYTGVRGATFRVVPGSAQHAGQAKWIMAAELVETTRLYGFTAARIRPEWVEEAAGELMRRSYFDAHWDPKRGQCMVYEQSALYGLTVIPRRKRRYAPISLEEARRIFIRSALVEGQLQHDAKFLNRNRRVVARLRGFDDRLRQPDVVISDDALFHFYDERVPVHVCDFRSFDGWAAQLSDEEADELCLNETGLVADRFKDDVPTRFPDTIDVGGQQLDLEYKFSPGAPDDGLTLRVPVDLLGEIDPRRFGWLVPGYLEEKVQALLRGLPKSLRREIVPLTEVTESFVGATGHTDTALVTALSGHLRRTRGVDIGESRWREDRLPDQLRMNFSVIDAEGVQVTCGRDFADLQRRFAAGNGASAAGAPDNGKTGLVDWTVGDMPEHLDLRRGARRVRVFPMLEDAGDSVSLSASESKERARALHRLGVRRLFMLANNRELQKLRKNLPGLDRLCLAYVLIADERPDWHAPRTDPRLDGKRRSGRSELAQDILEAGAWRALGESAAEVRSEAAFRQASAAACEALPSIVAEICELCEEILEGYRLVRKQFDESPIPGRAESIGDIKRHLSGLVFRGFVSATPYESLQAFPRYLQALNRRIDKLRSGGARDSDKVATLEPLWARFVARAKDHATRGRSDTELDRYRWMIEEFRVSLFAQEIGTAYPVSTQRLDGQWSRVTP